MAENDDGQEKSERATPKREQDAREEGQVPRSRELTTMLTLVASAAGFMFMGESIFASMGNIMRESFTIPRQRIFTPEAMLWSFWEAVGVMLTALAPYFLLMVLVALAAPILLGGWSFSVKALAWKWNRMDVIKGVARIFSVKSLVELLKAVGKFLVVGSVAWVMISAQFGQIMAIGRQSLEVALIQVAHIIGWTFMVVGASTVVIAIADVPFQLWDNARKLKMTHKQVKDEMKDTEGRPEVKSKVRQLQQEMSNRRMMDAVPTADVVVTNPTHFAVALKYKPDEMSTPIVVASGVDEMALRIRTMADAHDVPILETPPLARALYFSTKVDQPVPGGLFVAVAQVLAYVFQLKEADPLTRYSMAKPGKLPIPDEFYYPSEEGIE